MAGSLLQHIPGDGHRWLDDGTSAFHEVTVNGGGRLAGVYGDGVTLRVNSRHHQGVTEDRVAHGMKIVAQSADGFVEAMESEEHRWVVGIQWHPERPDGGMSPTAPLWRSFVEACELTH